jgi:hypothetical protein
LYEYLTYFRTEDPTLDGGTSGTGGRIDGSHVKPLSALKRSIFGFAGRANFGNLGSTFACRVGAPGTMHRRRSRSARFFEFTCGILIAPKEAGIDRPLTGAIKEDNTVNVAGIGQRC